MYVCPPEHTHDQTTTCHSSHGCRCTACKTAHTEYSYYYRHMRAAGRDDLFNRRVDATGTRRRIQALMCLGWSQRHIAALAGTTQQVISVQLHIDTVTRPSHDRMVAVFEQLSVALPPTDTPGQRLAVGRLKALARRNGWAPPFAWDDIDNDKHPAGTAPVADSIDHVLVDQALTGKHVRLTGAELRACIRTLHARRWSDVAIAAQLHCNEKTVNRIRRDELGMPAWNKDDLLHDSREAA